MKLARLSIKSKIVKGFIRCCPRRRKSKRRVQTNEGDQIIEKKILKIKKNLRLRTALITNKKRKLQDLKNLLF